eukprot:TRINITY_DN8163_c0_g1_i1.p1 TRINITY_DN8163_c0_g1~~TRINITY_DN8163_c0_g1_i1.p1  ORF type:complete len:391 (+),score=35.35 TRINITY_DN8163_c0_g1_i1:61-1233(+)
MILETYAGPFRALTNLCPSYFQRHFAELSLQSVRAEQVLRTNNIKWHHVDEERNLGNSLDELKKSHADSAGSRAPDASTLNHDQQREGNHGRDKELQESERKVLGSGIFTKLVVTRLGSDIKQKPLDGLEYQLGAERIQELLETDVPVMLSQNALSNEEFAFSCGGNLTVEFAMMKEVAAADVRLRAALPEDDLLRQTGQRTGADAPLKRCAVVGNSGDLLDHAHGADIDGFDTVIRFNAAPTKGYEEHVGRKTTIRILNMDFLHWPHARGTLALYTVRSQRDVRKFLHHQQPRSPRPAFLFHPEWWCHVWEWLGYRKVKPSTGFAGVVLALHFCSSVHLFGFSHSSSRFHYFNVLPEKVTKFDVYNFHPLIEEASLYRELESRGRLVAR